jgi:hypothetical protein
MKREPNIDIHATDIEYIKKDIAEIKVKLDSKYVSHETFDLTVRSLNSAIQMIVRAGIFLAAPIYASIIALLFKVFTN